MTKKVLSIKRLMVFVGVCLVSATLFINCNSGGNTNGSGSTTSSTTPPSTLVLDPGTAFSSCGLPDSELDSANFLTAIQGTWVFVSTSSETCIPISGNANILSMSQTLTYSTTNESFTATLYSDSSCTTKAGVVTITSNITLGATGPSGLGYQINETSEVATATPLTAAMASYWSSLDSCGFNNWQANAGKNVTSLSCEFYSNMPAFWFAPYNIIDVDNLSVPKSIVTGLPNTVQTGVSPSTTPVTYGGRWIFQPTGINSVTTTAANYLCNTAPTNVSGGSGCVATFHLPGGYTGTDSCQVYLSTSGGASALTFYFTTTPQIALGTVSLNLPSVVDNGLLYDYPIGYSNWSDAISYLPTGDAQTMSIGCIADSINNPSAYTPGPGDLQVTFTSSGSAATDFHGTVNANWGCTTVAGTSVTGGEYGTVQVSF